MVEEWKGAVCFSWPTWRIIPVSKWLVITPIYKPFTHLEGEQPYIGDLLTMVINHLLARMIF